LHTFPAWPTLAVTMTTAGLQMSFATSTQHTGWLSQAPSYQGCWSYRTSGNTTRQTDKRQKSRQIQLKAQRGTNILRRREYEDVRT
jgi:hypothetical protein